ncbi:LicD family protein [Massilia sp. TS11]|uniref:LicD family protein n=1 Tax=Massilia sp. TS11 TaxID=2908003 RepID=UPI001EDC0FAE|nr:LicD family protein [Massilia sp. TS11]MCG2585629.1 hypothetical protein [Massilia sp. TS11]
MNHAAAHALLNEAHRRMVDDAARAHTEFDQAVRSLGGAAGMLGARLQICRALCSLHLNQIARLQAEAAALLDTARTLPWPAEAPPRPTHFEPGQAREFLDATLVHLARRGLIAFATAGTLLGLVRDGALLPNDKDLDLVVPFRALDEACRAVRELGWEDSWVALNASNYRCFVHADSGITLDLIGYDSDPAGAGVLGGWWPQGLAREDGRLLRFSEFQITRQQSERGPYWALSEPRQMLEELYGPGWVTPDPHFDAILGTPALVAHNAFTHAWGHLRLGEAWINGRRAPFSRLLALLARLDPADPLLPLARAIEAQA